MHATIEQKCVADILFAHPILQALFTFLQMHFLFVNSEVYPEFITFPISLFLNPLHVRQFR